MSSMTHDEEGATQYGTSTSRYWYHTCWYSTGTCCFYGTVTGVFALYPLVVVSSKSCWWSDMDPNYHQSMYQLLLLYHDTIVRSRQHHNIIINSSDQPISTNKQQIHNKQYMMVLRKEILPILIVLAFCFMMELSSAFVVQMPKIKTSRIVHTATKVNEDDITNEVLGTLEKRLKEGSLTNEEKKAALMASDSLLEQLDDLESPANQYDEAQLRSAVLAMDVDAVDDMLKAGLEMDEKTTEEAFWNVVKAVDNSEAQDLPISANVTRMIHNIFDADQLLLQQREKLTTNVTCMMPDESTGMDGAARKMNYVFDDGDHKNLPIAEGRRCEGGNCCDKCSRNIFPTFATDKESCLETFPQLASLTFNELEKVSTSTIIQFVRLIERVRRTIAHEYGLPLKTILPLQAYSRKYVAGTTQKGGGGGEGDFVTLHTDEATHAGYHYSCVLYLSTQGVDFEGGNFVFNDPEVKSEEEKEFNAKEYSEEVDDKLLELLLKGELPEDGLVIGGTEDEEPESMMSLEEEIRRAGRKMTPFHPSRGAGVIFSSGWENMHEVEKITSGVRYAVPCFFTTCPVPDVAYEQMAVGKPKNDDDIADDWLHLLLAHQPEELVQSVGRVKELLMKWHYICTPLSEH